MREAKLISIHRSENDAGEFEIEFNFTWDRHLTITLDKEMSAEQLGALLVETAYRLTKLNDQEDWNTKPTN